jgi:hypothetical protein
MKKITSINDIDYKNNPEGRLLFSALSILTSTIYKDRTPDEAIDIINKHADTFLNHGEPTHDFNNELPKTIKVEWKDGELHDLEE